MYFFVFFCFMSCNKHNYRKKTFRRCSLVIPVSFPSVSMYAVHGLPLFLFPCLGFQNKSFSIISFSLSNNILQNLAFGNIELLIVSECCRKVDHLQGEFATFFSSSSEKSGSSSAQFLRYCICKRWALRSIEQYAFDRSTEKINFIAFWDLTFSDLTHFIHHSPCDAYSDIFILGSIFYVRTKVLIICNFF